MMRQFDQSLKEVQNLLLEMGSKLEVAIDKAVKSLASNNVAMAQQVIKDDVEIDRMEIKIDDVVAKLIATQQPVAKDLRKLIGGLKIASDMERMADLAVNIAKVTLEFEENNPQSDKVLEEISEMAKLTQKMVHDGINSYIDGNIELAKLVAHTDDQVDKLYEKILRDLIKYFPTENESFEVYFRIGMVARYLERIADHATNIAESIVYIETGRQADLN